MAKSVYWPGIFPAVTTEFNADSSINLKASQQSIEHRLRARCARFDHTGYLR